LGSGAFDFFSFWAQVLSIFFSFGLRCWRAGCSPAPEPKKKKKERQKTKRGGGTLGGKDNTKGLGLEKKVAFRA
jgi:hypothetical protein